jgi:GNAT superfamily N-acetyltransferase
VTEPPADGPDGIAIRMARPNDAPGVADVYLAAFHSTYDFALAHSDEQVRDWLTNEVVPRMETWVAEADGHVIAMMVLADAWLEQLYVDPAWHNRGIGGRLVELAKSRQPGGMNLYTFQVNDRARRFYERHGFVVAALGDGTTNEEHQPDVRYEWRP